MIDLWLKTSADLARSILRRGRRQESDLLRIERRATEPRADRLRVASYNLMGGWMSSIERLAEELIRIDPDVVAIQEIDHESERSGRVDQTRVLAEALGMSSVFCGAIRLEGGHYGNALLSRIPIRSAVRIRISALFDSNPRSAIDATLEWNGDPLRMIAVHLDHLPWSAAIGARQLSRRLEGVPGRLIVAGDLNAPPSAPGPKSLTRLGLTDLIGRFDEGPTFHADRWAFRLDYVLVDSALAARARSGARIATQSSDHYPVVVELGPAPGP